MKTFKYMILVFACLVVLTFLPACQGQSEVSKAPDFTLLNLAGNTVNLSDFSGKVVLINFFATYCPPCRMEIPDFVKLQKEFSPKGFTVIGISVDNDGERVLPPFVERLGINYPVLLATTKVLKDYGDIYALPVTFILDREHKIVKKITGMVNEEELRPIIKELLGSSSSQNDNNHTKEK